MAFNGTLYSNDVSGASFLVPITLTGPLAITNTSPDLQQLSVGDINLNGNTLTFDTGVFINELGAISGNGRVEKDGSGALKIFADGSFTGPFNINGGTVVAMTAHALGASGSDSGTFLARQTHLVFQASSNLTVPESIALLGANAYLEVDRHADQGGRRIAAAVEHTEHRLQRVDGGVRGSTRVGGRGREEHARRSNHDQRRHAGGDHRRSDWRSERRHDQQRGRVAD